MAKKKSQSVRKHRFKHSEPSAVQASQTHDQTMMATPPHKPVASRAVSTVESGRDFSYVTQDMRRVLALAAALVAVEVLGWYVMNHTGIGSTVYSWVKV